jgi:hypothetical protein
MRKDLNKNEAKARKSTQKCVGELAMLHQTLPTIIEAEAVCEYIETITCEMSIIAQRSGVSVLSCLLDLASVEAHSVKIELQNTRKLKTTSSSQRQIESKRLEA